MTHHQTTVTEWRGRELVGNDGDTIGTIDEVYVDATTGQASSTEPGASHRPRPGTADCVQA